MAAKKQELVVEVTTKADQAKRDLAELDKTAKDLGGKPVEIPVDLKGDEDVKTKLKTTERAADGTKNAFANLVGNTAQDLSGLGGAFSSIGVAIGQVAEFTADAANEGGGLTAALSGAASMAGPMLALAAAGFAVQKVMGDMKKQSEEAKAANQAFLDSMVKGAGILDDWGSALDDAFSKGTTDQVQDLNKFLKDTLDKTGDLEKTTAALGQMGLTLDDLGSTLNAADKNFKSMATSFLESKGFGPDVAARIAGIVSEEEKLSDVLNRIDELQINDVITPEQAVRAKEFAKGLEQVNDVVEKLDTEAQAKQFNDINKAASGMADVVDKARAAGESELSIALQVNDAMQAQKTAREENARAAEEGAQAVADAGTIIEQVGRQEEEAATRVADAMDKAKAAQDNWLTQNVTYEATVDSFTESLQKLVEQTEKQAKAGDEGAGSFEGNTKAALDNRDALRDVYAKATDLIGGMKDAGFSVDGARTAQDNMAQSAYDLAVKMGLPIDKAQEIHDKILAIPPSVTSDVVIAEQGYAEVKAKKDILEEDIETTVFFQGVLDRSLLNAINSLPPGAIPGVRGVPASGAPAPSAGLVSVGAMAVPASAGTTATVNVNLSGGIVADTFQLTRVVERAVRAGTRLGGSRP